MGGLRLCPGMARDATRQEGETDPDANTEPGRPWRSIGVQAAYANRNDSHNTRRRNRLRSTQAKKRQQHVAEGKQKKHQYRLDKTLTAEMKKQRHPAANKTKQNTTYHIISYHTSPHLNSAVLDAAARPGGDLKHLEHVHCIGGLHRAQRPAARSFFVGFVSWQAGQETRDGHNVKPASGEHRNAGMKDKDPPHRSQRSELQTQTRPQQGTHARTPGGTSFSRRRPLLLHHANTKHAHRRHDTDGCRP